MKNERFSHADILIVVCMLLNRLKVFSLSLSVFLPIIKWTRLFSLSSLFDEMWVIYWIVDRIIWNRQRKEIKLNFVDFLRRLQMIGNGSMDIEFVIFVQLTNSPQSKIIIYWNLIPTTATTKMSLLTLQSWNCIYQLLKFQVGAHKSIQMNSGSLWLDLLKS